MKIASAIARYVIAAMMLLGGGSTFFMGSPPPEPGLMGQFNQIFFASHWAQVVGFAQVVMAVLLIANRYVPLALVMVAAFVYNSLAFHFLIAPPALLPMAFIVPVLWVIVALRYRDAFAQFLDAKPDPVAAPAETRAARG